MARVKNAVKAIPSDDDLSRQDFKERLARARERHEQELGLRGFYGYSLLWTAITQIALINLWFVLQATHVFHADDNTFRVFSVSVFSEVIALALVVTRSIFPKHDDSPMPSPPSDASAAAPPGVGDAASQSAARAAAPEA